MARVQSEEGELPVFCAYSPDMTDRRQLDPCVFGAALIASLIGTCPGAAEICGRACDFIEAQRRRRNVWTYYKKRHGILATPPDVDSTAMATAALVACGRPRPDNLSAVLANLDRQGMFLTWMFPTRGASKLRLPIRAWRHLLNLLRLPNYRALLKHTPWEAEDVSAGVNANVLAAFAPFEGDERVVHRILAIVREGREDSCDKYYDNPNLVRYFFSRALAGRCPEARELLLERMQAGPDLSPIDLALVILVRVIWCAPLRPELIQRLIAAQDSSGAWPIAPLYCAGRKRTGYMQFAPTEPGWFRLGSEAITTAFCVNALDAVTRGRA